MDGYRDPIFKGCTRPAMLAGVPLVPMVLSMIASFLAGMWSFYFLSGYLVVVIAFSTSAMIISMRDMTKRDDQRIRQMLLQARMRLRHRTSRSLWSAISYGPLHYKVRWG
ncbi:MAG: VirB3 family type IV secretion system protein [Nitrospira sp.]